jgi:hypothetical protein
MITCNEKQIQYSLAYINYMLIFRYVLFYTVFCVKTQYKIISQVDSHFNTNKQINRDHKRHNSGLAVHGARDLEQHQYLQR